MILQNRGLWAGDPCKGPEWDEPASPLPSTNFGEQVLIVPAPWLTLPGIRLCRTLVEEGSGILVHKRSFLFDPYLQDKPLFPVLIR